MKLKSTTIAVLLAVSASVHAAVVDYDAGDLVMSFYATGGTGSTVNVSVSLGDLATAFRGNPIGSNALSGSSYWTSAGGGSFTFNLGTALGGILNTQFGAGWHERTDLYWGISGVLTNSNFANPVGGDPRKTVYVSRPSGSNTWSGYTSGAVGEVATNMISFQNAFNALDSVGGQPLVAVYSDSLANSFESWQYNGNTRLADWENFLSSNANPGTPLVVDRLLHIATGANPSGTIGNGSPIGTFTLDSDGQLTFGVVPEPSTVGLIAVAGLALGFSLWKHRRSLKA